MGAKMNRDIHVRFCESADVQRHYATHLAEISRQSRGNRRSRQTTSLSECIRIEWKSIARRVEPLPNAKVVEVESPEHRLLNVIAQPMDAAIGHADKETARMAASRKPLIAMGTTGVHAFGVQTVGADRRDKRGRIRHIVGLGRAIVRAMPIAHGMPPKHAGSWRTHRPSTSIVSCVQTDAQFA